MVLSTASLPDSGGDELIDARRARRWQGPCLMAASGPLQWGPFGRPLSDGDTR